MTISEIILHRRKELNMTQKELAEKLNVTDRTVSRWECGVNLPDVEMLKTISKVLNVDITYFYEDVPTKDINYTEEYDYEVIKNFKIKSIVPFILVVISIIATLIVKGIMLEVTFPLGLFSNTYNMIRYAFESGIVNTVGILIAFLLMSFIFTIISYILYLRNSISFKCFYKEKMFQTAYIDAHKKIKFPYLALFVVSIIFLFI